MAKFVIQAQDGRKLTIEAPDEETAKRGAREWIAANPLDVREEIARQNQPAPEGIQPETQQRFDKALEAVRTAFFPDMDPAKFAEMANNGLSTLNKPNLGDRVKSGTLLGFDDELSSTFGAASAQLGALLGQPGGKNFTEAWPIWQEFYEARKNLGQEDGGFLGNLVEGVGSMGSLGMPKGGGAPPRPAAVSAGRGAETLPGNLVRNMTLTAAPSAIYGFGDTEGDLGERAKGATKGAATGAVAGGLFTLGARAAGAGLRYAGGNKAPSGLSIPADDMITRAMMGDDVLGNGRGAANIARAGNDAMLVDAGPSMTSLLDTAIQHSGEGAGVARRAIGDRIGRANANVDAALDQALGPPRGRFTTEEAMRQSARPANKAAYDTARAQPIDYASDAGQHIETLLQRVPQEAIARANRLMKLRGEKSAQIMATIGEDGSVVFKTMPDVTQLDYITRALREEAKAGIGLGAMGGQTDVGSALSGLATEIRDTLKVAVPEYGVALETAAGPIGERAALETGEQLLNPALPRDEAAALVGKMTGPEKAAARQAIRSKFDELVANVRQAASDPNMDARELRKLMELTSSAAVREKIALLMDKPQSDAMFKALDEAMRALELNAGVARNSATMARTSTDRAIGELVEGGPIEAALEGKPLDMAKRTIAGATGRTPAEKLSRKDAIYTDIARALTETRGAQAAAQANKIGQRAPLAAPALPLAVQPAIETVPPDARKRIMQALGMAGGF